MHPSTHLGKSHYNRQDIPFRDQFLRCSWGCFQHNATPTGNAHRGIAGTTHHGAVGSSQGHDVALAEADVDLGNQRLAFVANQ